MADEPRSSPLRDRHEALGARLTDFAGWIMPVSYEGTVAEHTAVREDVGVFDVSHLGTVWIVGNGAGEAVGASFTNDPDRLEDGECQYTLSCRDDGGILDDLIVYRVASNRYLAVPNAANTDAVVGVLERAASSHGAEIRDESEGHAILAVQGPNSFELLRDALDLDASSLDYMSFRRVESMDTDALLCRTGYTGELGCELVIPSDAAGTVWDALVHAGATPVGLAARDTLRLEMGYPLHGNDLSVDRNPYEARLGWAVKLDRGAFVGQEALRALADDEPDELLRGLRGRSRRPPRHGMTVTADGEEVGTVTSGSFSPTLEVGVGLAYLRRDIEPGQQVEVDVRGTAVTYEVVDPPFVDRSPRG